MNEHDILLSILEHTKKRYEMYYQFEQISDEQYTVVCEMIDDIIEEVIHEYGKY